MIPKLTILLLLALLVSCNKVENNKVEPGEVAATIISEVIIDNFTKGCSGGGLIIEIKSKSYTIANPVPALYFDANSRPFSVWVRYKASPPDLCTQSTDRINVLSIRKRK